MRALLEIFQFCSNWQEVEKMTITLQFADMILSPSFYFHVVICLLSMFHVIIATTSKVMTIFINKGLTRNTTSKVMTIFINKGLTRNTSLWVLSNIWRLRQVRDTKIGVNASNEKLLNATKCKSCSFYRFWVIKRKTIRIKGLKLLNKYPQSTK